MCTPDEAIAELTHVRRHARPEGVPLRTGWSPTVAGGPGRGTRGAYRLGSVRYDVVGLDSPTTTTRCGASAASSSCRADLPQRRPLDPAAQLAVELLLQPHRPLRLRGPRGGQGALLRRRHPAIPGPQLRLPRGRSGLGLHALRGPHRPLGEAQRAGHRVDDPGKLDRAQLLALARSTAAPRSSRRCAAARAWRATPTRRSPAGVDGRRRLLPLRDRAEAGHPRPVRAALLLRLRGRRPDQRVGVQHEGQPHAAPA